MIPAHIIHDNTSPMYLAARTYIHQMLASGLRLAILVNFNVRRLVEGLKRIAL